MESPSCFKSPLGRLVRFLTLASALFASLPHALSQTALTNGLIEYDGKIDWGDVDEWVFNAEAGDFISLRMAVDEYKDEAPTPYIYLDFNGEVLWSESGNFRFDMNKTLIAPYTGKYHIQIGDVNGVPLLGRIEYILSLAQSGSPFTTREGDQGGPLTNGLRHSGQLIRGDSDMWSFEVEAGQNIDISVVETEAFGNLSIGLRVFDETGASVASDFDSTNSKVNFIAESAGTYTVIVQNDSTDDDANGSYHLYYSRFPDEITISEGDEGGPLQNGARTTGTIDTGDVDLWTFHAEIGDPIDISVAKTSGSISPHLQVFAPDGSSVVWDSDSDNAKVFLYAEQAGTYIVKVENGNANAPQLTGTYDLYFSNMLNDFVISQGDEGGALQNGARTPGTIDTGDVDLWTFDAEIGDPIDISVAKTSGSISPYLQVFAPDGSSVVWDSDSYNAKVFLRAEQDGTYIVKVENGNANAPELAGTYDLYFSSMLNDFVISQDDEGGPLQNGARTPGTIDTGDVDLWTFDAEIGDPVNISSAVTGGNISPYLIVFAPDGTTAAWDSDNDNAKVFLRAEQTGRHVIAVENGNANAPELAGTYDLYFSNMMEEFTVSEGDEGGPLQSGARTLGTIDTGDVDLWTFDAEIGNPIYLSFAETGGNFSPYLIVFSPDGTTAAWDSDNGNAEVFLTAEQTGRYVISVENGNANAPELTGSYKLTYFNNASNDGYVGFVLSEGYPLAGSGFQDDLNEDGFSNGLAYALGLPINQPFSDTSPTLVISAASSDPVLEFRLPEQRPNDITYKVEFSVDLTTPWAPIATLESNATSWQLNHENGVIETDGYDVRIGMRSEQETHDGIFLRLTVGIE
ncbi:PPC domain-containing protein [Pelagicoccus sp. SDUM812005]|uniref:PPC domain-containing protein n=1 Tax=Pelagicoccus sp. SDUM812005 TaxID=3041257 RepID=UPI00280EA9A5|nr:PPC domain-containing protein [Pelagicoccus sp. SDUM812005]MDQ8182223.1 PPC domain-containing protein [Pelagicoccus sp. SDUM812005]